MAPPLAYYVHFNSGILF